MERIENNSLALAGLEIMRKTGKPLERLPIKGRAMLYKMPNGETVRVRTCNDHVLIIVADRPDADAKLNIEGTDWLLIVMPEIERTQGKVISYLVPTSVAVEAARNSHQEWLKANPRTKGNNLTWNLWFQTDARGKSNLFRANGYAETWKKYRIQFNIEATNDSQTTNSPSNIKVEVENARKRIAQAAGVPIDAVRISIDFAA